MLPDAHGKGDNFEKMGTRKKMMYRHCCIIKRMGTIKKYMFMKHDAIGGNKVRESYFKVKVIDLCVILKGIIS